MTKPSFTSIQAQSHFGKAPYYGSVRWRAKSSSSRLQEDAPTPEAPSDANGPTEAAVEFASWSLNSLTRMWAIMGGSNKVEKIIFSHTPPDHGSSQQSSSHAAHGSVTQGGAGSLSTNQRLVGKTSSTNYAQGYVALGHYLNHFFVWSVDMETIHQIHRRDLHNRSILVAAVGSEYGMKEYELVASNGNRRINYEKMGNDLRDSCVNAGKFAIEQVRGCGVWLDESGDLIVNSSQLFLASSGAEINRLVDSGKFIYPNDGDLGISPDTPIATLCEMHALRQFLDAFNFARGATDARLILGWLVQAYLVAAIEWRPHIFVHAPAACGKSTIRQVLGRLLGRAAESFSYQGAAGLRQAMRDKSGAVLLDEAWAGNRFSEVLMYLRLGSDGSVMTKGTDKQEAVWFHIRTSGALFGVVLPAMERQDGSRFIAIEMIKHNNDPLLHPLFPSQSNLEYTEKLGKRMFSRSLKRWRDFSHAHDLIRCVLRKGPGARTADSFAPLLAGVWIAENDVALTDGTQAQKFVNSFDLEEDAARQNELTAEDNLFEQILSTTIERGLGNRRMSIGDLLRAANEAGGEQRNEAALLLRTYGFRVEPWLDENGIEVEGIRAIQIDAACADFKLIAQRAGVHCANYTTLLRKMNGVRYNRNRKKRFGGNPVCYVEIPYDFNGPV